MHSLHCFSFLTAQMRVLSLLAVATVVDAAAVELTKENFKGLIEGKGAFVKFLAPW